MGIDVGEILQKYYYEATSSTFNERSPSRMARGEGVSADYFILKIDLCGSTDFIRNRNAQTYLRFAHVFLSSVDHICRKFGADGTQVEYAGDSVLSYFPANSCSAGQVLVAAHLSRLASYSMRNLDAVFKQYKFDTRVALHYGELILANIGPWGDYRLTAIGRPLHIIGHMEKQIKPGGGRATIEFGRQMPATLRRRYLEPITVQNIAPELPSAWPSSSPVSPFYPLNNLNLVPTPPVIQSQTVAYSVNWHHMALDLSK